MEPARSPRFGVDAVEGEGPRVLSIQIHTVGHDVQLTASQRYVQSAVEDGSRPASVHRSVVGHGVAAEAVVRHPRDADPVTRVAGPAGGIGLQGPETVGADGGADGHALGDHTRADRLEVQDATGCVSVRGRRRATDDLHPAQTGEVQVIEGRLSVGESGRDPVDDDPDAPDAELGPCPEAANGEALADGQIVAVLHLQARHSPDSILDEGG